MQEITLGHKKKTPTLFYCEGAQTTEQVVQRACVGLLLLEIFRSAKDTVLGSLLTPC